MDAHMSIAASTTRDASPSVAPTSGRKTDEARRAAKRDPHINSKALLRPRGRSVSGNARVPIQSLRRAAGLLGLLFSRNKRQGGWHRRSPRAEFPAPRLRSRTASNVSFNLPAPLHCLLSRTSLHRRERTSTSHPRPSPLILIAPRKLSVHSLRAFFRLLTMQPHHETTRF